MSVHILIPERFRGPPVSANGGYATGVFGGLLTQSRFDLPQNQAAEVTLRAPIPLDRELSVHEDGAGLRVMDDERLIAEVAQTTLALEVPAPASWEQALAVRDASPSLHDGLHPIFRTRRLGFHPVCFCCGAELTEGEGLQVYAAPVPGLRQVAAAWSCHPNFADERGRVPPEIVCAALDCPGQFAWMAEGTITGLLGRLCVRVEKPIAAGERCVVIGWTLGREGRKYYAGTALFDASGTLCAYARAVWIGRPG